MQQAGAPLTLRRFFDRVLRRSFGDLALRDDPAADYLSDLLTRFARTEHLYPRKGYFRPEYGPRDLPFFRRLLTE